MVKYDIEKEFWQKLYFSLKESQVYEENDARTLCNNRLKILGKGLKFIKKLILIFNIK